MRILIWHLHGSWMTSFVQGPHDYLVPVTPDRGPFGLGRARTWDWPASVVEVTPPQLRDTPVDMVVLQRPEELALAADWLGRVPGRDVPAVYVEHDTPTGPAAGTPHPMAGTEGIMIVHVTQFNARYWDCGRSPVAVIEHGIADPGARWTGEVARAAVVINDPLTRGRTVGTDLLAGFARHAPLDVFGMRVTGLGRAQGMTAGAVPRIRGSAPGPAARAAAPATGLRAPVPLDVAWAIPDRGHVPRHAGGGARRHRGTASGAASGRGDLHRLDRTAYCRQALHPRP